MAVVVVAAVVVAAVLVALIVVVAVVVAAVVVAAVVVAAVVVAAVVVALVVVAVGHTVTRNRQVGDRHIAPPTSSAIYSERLLLLPRCYQINDHAQTYRGALKPPPPSELRRKFTYANFNQLMKVSSDVLDVWAGAMMRTSATRVVLLTGVTSARLQCAEIQPRCGADGAADGPFTLGA